MTVVPFQLGEVTGLKCTTCKLMLSIVGGGEINDDQRNAFIGAHVHG